VVPAPTQSTNEKIIPSRFSPLLFVGGGGGGEGGGSAASSYDKWSEQFIKNWLRESMSEISSVHLTELMLRCGGSQACDDLEELRIATEVVGVIGTDVPTCMGMVVSGPIELWTG
jgi:hypothetical protein